jgi:aromatic ring-opening dioxygenase catalytic subunit (LigB family)
MTAWPEAAPKEQSDRFLDYYRKLGEMLAASKPDTLVAITVEHWANFFLNHMPAFCIGRADHYEGPVEEWLKIPEARVPGDAKLGAELLDACLDGGFDPTFSDELLFDHATMLPLHFLNPNMAVPVVPVIINTLTPPMPTPKRCFAFGQFLGKSSRDPKNASPSSPPAACPIGRERQNMERSTFPSTGNFSTP